MRPRAPGPPLKSRAAHPGFRKRRAGGAGQSVQAALAVIERNGRYLIARRRAGDFLGGYWEFPGGKRLPGESWKDCLRRELKEELGIGARSLTPYMRLRYRYAGRSVLFQVFRCRLAPGRPKPLEAQALRWVSRAQLRRHRFPPANRLLIDRLAGPLPSSVRHAIIHINRSVPR